MIRPSMKQDPFSWDDPCFRPIMAYPGLQATPVMQEKKMSKVQKSRVVHLCWRFINYEGQPVQLSKGDLFRILEEHSPNPGLSVVALPGIFAVTIPKTGHLQPLHFVHSVTLPTVVQNTAKKNKHNKTTIWKMMKMELICKFWGGITAMLGLKRAQQLCQLSCSQEAPWSLRTSSLARYTLASGLLDGANYYHPSSMAGNGKLYCQWVDFPLQSLIPRGHVC